MASRRNGARGWLGPLLGLCVLAVGGFTLGLVSGIAVDEPGLVFGYLFGDTEEVAWGGAAGDAGLPEVAASAPAPNTAAPTRTPPPAAAPRSAVRAPGAGQTTGRLAVQVGAFAENGAAEELALRLRGKGFPVYVTPGAASGSARWRVRVGPLATREEADRAAARLKRDEGLPTWVLGEDGS
jgi:hypothetical protein